MTRCATCLKENPPQYLTVDEVSRLLRVSKMTVYRLIESGDIKSARIGRAFRIRADHLDAYVKALDAA